LPWLTGAAFPHSELMQEKRGMTTVWDGWLVFVPFMSCILGTLLTRSVVVSSVHGFAESRIGTWIVGFCCLVWGGCMAAYLKNKDYLKSENQLDSLVSRESSFLFNNLVLLVACVAVLSGTLFPVFSEWFTGSRISVGAPFFNKVNIPLGLLLLFLTGVGPLLAWRKTSTESLKRNFLWPSTLGLTAGGVGFVLGFREIFSLICLILCVFVASTIVQEFYRGAKVVRVRTSANWLTSCLDLTLRNTRRYGGYVVHFGMVMIFIGLAGPALYKGDEKGIAPRPT